MTKEEFIEMMKTNHIRLCKNAHLRMIEAKQIKLLFKKMSYDKKSNGYYIIANNTKFYLDRILDSDLFIKYNLQL